MKKRQEKFGAGSSLVSEDPAVLDERKKKFGGNDVCLDDEIEKSKEKRQHHKSFHKNGRNFSQDRFRNKRNQPFRRDKNFGNPHKRVKRWLFAENLS